MRLCVALFLLVVASPLQAQTLGSTSGASSTVNISDPPNANSTSRLITTPTVVAPGLAAAGIETCLGSASGGISVMGGGLTFGSTVVDSGCTIRLLARQLYAFGFQKAALALMCQDGRVALAMDTAGSPCPASNAGRGGPVAMLSADPPEAAPADGGEALAMMATDRPAISSAGISQPLSILPITSSTPAENGGTAHASFTPVQPFSQAEQAWFDRASNIN